MSETVQGKHRGVTYNVGPRAPFSGIRWWFKVGNFEFESGGGFYDNYADHPEGAYQWAICAVKRAIDKLYWMD